MNKKWNENEEFRMNGQWIMVWKCRIGWIKNGWKWRFGWIQNAGMLIKNGMKIKASRWIEMGWKWRTSWNKIG